MISHQKFFVKMRFVYFHSIACFLQFHEFFPYEMCEIFILSRNVFHTVWKLREFSLTKKKFRQINSLATYLVKSLLSRNFCQKCLRENSRNFHTVHQSLIQTVIVFLTTYHIIKQQMSPQKGHM